MRITLLLAFTIILLNSCKSSHSHDSVTTVEDNEKEMQYFDFDSSLTLSCNICLIKDSIDQIRTSLNYAKAYEEPIDSNLIKSQRKLEDILEDWKRDLKKNHKDLFEMELPENWSSRDPENIALQSCKKEYAFTDRLDSIQRLNYLFQYVCYSAYSDVGEMYPDIDTSEFDKSGGYYHLKFQGETVRIRNNEFPQYWENAVESYDSVRTYINGIKDVCVKQIAGKQMTQLSKIERLMFLEHVRIVNLESSGKSDFLLNDQTYQKLYKNWKQTWLNK